MSLALLGPTPFKNSIDISTSYRFSDYSLSQKSDTFDLGIKYPLTDEFVLKASAQKAIRVPDIHELFEETHAKFVALSADPCSGSSPDRALADCERTGVTPSLYGSIETPASSIATTTGGNLNLLPEKHDFYPFGGSANSSLLYFLGRFRSLCFSQTY
mgnify:CR=1 FL=1